MHLRATYESGVLFVLRFMVDTGVVRCYDMDPPSWHGLAVSHRDGQWSSRPSRVCAASPNPAVTGGCSSNVFGWPCLDLPSSCCSSEESQAAAPTAQVGGNWVELPADKYVFHALGDSQKQSHCQMEAHVHYRSEWQSSCK